MSRRQKSRQEDIDLVWQLSHEKQTRGCLFIGDLEAARNLPHLKSSLQEEFRASHPGCHYGC